MSNFHKSKQYDLIDMCNDTSRYLDDIFTINNPEFEKHIPDIYPTELQLNKAITPDKETSFLDLNILKGKKETHIHLGCYLYHWCIKCVKKSLFEMLNIHICTHCETFLSKETKCVRMLMVKAIGVTKKGKSTPY